VLTVNVPLWLSFPVTATTSTLTGTPVVPGVAFAPVVVARAGVPAEAVEAFVAPVAPDDAIALFDAAAAAVSDGLEKKAAGSEGAAQEVLRATAGLARDTGLRAAVATNVRGGDPLLLSLRGAVEQFVGVFTQLGGLMAERVTDLLDVEKRLVARIIGVPEPGIPTPVEPSVLVAEDLAPADTAGLDATLIVGLATEKGGPTSHTAIIARQLGIPCVVGASGVLDITAGTPVLLDGATGLIEVDPDPVSSGRRVAEDVARRAAIDTWQGPAATADGTRVKLLANVGDGATARAAATGPVEGSGLFRTELCFLNSSVEPSIEEQAAVYAEVLDAFGAERTVVVRTLDAGSDKPIAYATHDEEQNPALGVRGLRLSFDNPGLLTRQLDAVAVAAERSGTKPWVMAPMVATAAEAAAFADQVRDHGLTPGVMIEIPAAALHADRILDVVDFVSIGTNDLTQYAMAADRMASDLAHLTDAWQPAVLALIRMVAQAGLRAAKPVGVCGEAAADPQLAAVLVGLGVTSLSMASAAVKPVGAQIGVATLDDCRRAADAALSAADPASARTAVRAILERSTA
jgi:phosphoenolpyruvate-protein phosphotransferase (PTS system enzyme I)